jgi:hypothetical protein
MWRNAGRLQMLARRKLIKRSVARQTGGKNQFSRLCHLFILIIYVFFYSVCEVMQNGDVVSLFKSVRVSPRRSLNEYGLLVAVTGWYRTELPRHCGLFVICCVSIWVIIIPHSSTRAVWQIPAKTLGSTAGRNLVRMYVDFADEASVVLRRDF